LKLLKNKGGFIDMNQNKKDMFPDLKRNNDSPLKAWDSDYFFMQGNKEKKIGTISISEQAHNRIINRYLLLSCVFFAFLVLSGCENFQSADDDSTSQTHNTVTTANYAPTSVTNKTFDVGYDAGRIKFKTSSSCIFPNDTLPSGYLWNVRPTYTYKLSTTANKAILVVSYTYAYLSTFKIYKHYQSIYTLTFTKKNAGTYREERYKRTTRETSTTLFSDDDTSYINGNFELK